MKTNLILLLSITFAVSCSHREVPQYGEAVFGTVSDSIPTVRITSGVISGENRDGVAIFRGIPYGGNCDGDNRFKAPTPVEPWEGIRECTVNGKIAMQNAGSISANPSELGNVFNGGHPELFGCENEVEDENCLVLNVLTPGIDAFSRPVLVYIHGGGFTTGTGSLVLGADKMAREEDLVIVGVNHRLNALGYLYLGNFDSNFESSGSVGIQDLVQALEWVRDNIAVFGGDPSNVTLIGESGGAMKICTLLSMPSAKGLFAKAILESGAYKVGDFTVEKAAEQTDKLLKKLGIPESDWGRILKISAQELVDAITGINFNPVADGKVIPICPNGDWAPAISSEIPVMVGASADEMGVFTPINEFAGNITWNNIRDVVCKSCHMTEEKADTVIKVFREQNFKDDAPWHTYVKILSQSGLLGYGAFNCAYARSAENMAPVYQYYVEYDSESVISPELRCAWHTADLPLQFRIVYHSKCEDLSRQMSHAWAAFARTGNPSTAALEWPAYTNDERNVMVFDDCTTVKKDPLKAIREILEK